MRRREFIAGLGSAAAWPLAARAQQGERMRRVGVLMAFDENDPGPKRWFSGLTQRLAELGWTDGRNMRMEVRWAAGNVDRMRVFAKELVDLQPDVIVAETTPVTAAVQRETRTIPIVVLEVTDPIGSGFVTSLARPGANITGFSNFEPSQAGKWVELLAEIAPGVKRVAAMFSPDTAPYVERYFLPSFEAAARSFKVTSIVAPVHSEAEIESVITSLGREPGGGLMVVPGAFTFAHRGPIILLAARNKVPAIYVASVWARDGGLLSFGADQADTFRRAAPYVDRILRGGKPAELPVQLPTKFELAVNLKTAKAMGLTIPESFLLRADEVIE